MSDPSCVFCKIIAGEIPALSIHEDERVLAFLDIGPLAEGHVLAIPKSHAETLNGVPPEELEAIARILPDLGAAVLKVTGAEGYNVLQNNGSAAGQVVPHVHFHVIPRRKGDGLGYRWNASKYPEGRGEELHKQLLEALSDTTA